MKIAQIALLFVVVIDIMGQGLVLPLVTALGLVASLWREPMMARLDPR